MTETWTNTRVARLTEMFCAGYPASAIAKDLGGVTRNAVIGKSHRLNLTSPRNRIDWTAERTAELRGFADGGKTRAWIAAYYGVSPRTIYNQALVLGLQIKDERFKLNYLPRPKAARRRPFSPVNWLIKQDEPPPNPFPFMRKLVDLADHHCRWPEGEGAKIKFCGQRRDRAGGSYCARHQRMAYVKGRPPAPINYAKTFSDIHGYV